MEEEKNASLNLFKILKKYIYSYPLGWFVIGFLLLFYLNLYYNVFDYRNPFRNLLTFAIIFSFSIINIATNYDKNRSKFKWLFWDCLASMYFLCFSFGYLMSFIGNDWGSIIIVRYSFIDYALEDFLFIFEKFLKNHFGYTPFISGSVGFKDLDGFFIFIPIFISIIGYDFYRKKAIKEILRTRCFLILVMLSLSRISLFMAVLLG